jgi:hypothetical protein
MSSTTQTRQVPVHALRPGDILSGSRETVVSVSAGIHTQRNKMEAVLEKNGRRRLGVWGRHTLVNVVERGQ